MSARSTEKAAGSLGCVSWRWASCRGDTSCCPRRSRWKLPRAERSPSPETSFRTVSRSGKAGRFADGAAPSPRGSARWVANVAWPPATVAAKRTEWLHTDLKIALPGLEEAQRREAGLRPHRLWRDGVHRPSHRRISGDVLSRRRCSVLGDRGTLDRQAPEGACRHPRTRRSAFG